MNRQVTAMEREMNHLGVDSHRRSSLPSQQHQFFPGGQYTSLADLMWFVLCFVCDWEPTTGVWYMYMCLKIVFARVGTGQNLAWKRGAKERWSIDFLPILLPYVTICWVLASDLNMYAGRNSWLICVLWLQIVGSSPWSQTLFPVPWSMRMDLGLYPQTGITLWWLKEGFPPPPVERNGIQNHGTGTV